MDDLAMIAGENLIGWGSSQVKYTCTRRDHV